MSSCRKQTAQTRLKLVEYSVETHFLLIIFEYNLFLQIANWYRCPQKSFLLGDLYVHTENLAASDGLKSDQVWTEVFGHSQYNAAFNRTLLCPPTFILLVNTYHLHKFPKPLYSLCGSS